MTIHDSHLHATDGRCLDDQQVGRCSGCKHWDTAFQGNYGEGPIVKRAPDYEDEPLLGRWGDCQRILHRQSQYASDWQPDAGDLAFLSDGSGYFASITTRAEFGCLLWEPKP